jgi:hypothetical protein
LGCLTALLFAFSMAALLFFFAPINSGNDMALNILAVGVMSLIAGVVGWVFGWFVGLFVCNH